MNFKSLTTVSVVAVAGLLLSSCAGSAGEEASTTGSESVSGGSSEGLVFNDTSEPGDVIEAELFNNVDVLGGFFGKVLDKTKLSGETEVMVVADGDSVADSYYDYSIYEPETGVRVDFSYYSFLEEQTCSSPVLLNFNTSQNTDFNLPANSRVNLFDVEMFTESVFNTVVGFENSLTGDTWVVNGLNVFVLSGDYYYRHVVLNSDGSVSSIVDYMHNAEPTYGFDGVVSGSVDYLTDEDGALIFDDNGDPILDVPENSTDSVDPRGQTVSTVMGSGVSADSLKAFSTPVSELRVGYSVDDVLKSFNNVETDVNWWLEVGGENVANPEFYSTAVNLGGSLGVASDGTIFAHNGDYYSGLNLFNPATGDSGVTLKNGSALTCEPVGSGEDIEYRDGLNDTFNENREAAERDGVEVDEYGVGGDDEVFIEGF